MNKPKVFNTIPAELSFDGEECGWMANTGWVAEIGEGGLIIDVGGVWGKCGKNLTYILRHTKSVVAFQYLRVIGFFASNR